MTPFSSVAMLEKLALLKIAFCNAPVLSKALLRRISAPTSSTLPTSSSGDAGAPGSADIVLSLCRVVGIGAVQDRTARCQRCPCQQLTADRRPTRLNLPRSVRCCLCGRRFPGCDGEHDSDTDGDESGDADPDRRETTEHAHLPHTESNAQNHDEVTRRETGG